MRAALAGVVLVITLGVAAPAEAETYPGDIHHGDRTLVVYVDPALEPIVGEISWYLNSWNRIRHSNWPVFVAAHWGECRWYGTGTVTMCADPNLDSVGTAISRSDGTHFVGGSAVLLNPNKWGACHSVEYAVAHEFGHVMGLDHRFGDAGSVMSYECKRVAYTAAEVADLDRIYH